MSDYETWTSLCEAGHEANWSATPSGGSTYECRECEPAPVTPAPVVLEPGTSWGFLRGGSRRRGVS